MTPQGKVTGTLPHLVFGLDITLTGGFQLLGNYWTSGSQCITAWKKAGLLISH